MIWSVVLWLIAGICVLAIMLLLTVLCSPVRIIARFDTEKERSLEFSGSLLGGLIKLPVSAAKNRKNQSTESRQKTKKKPDKSRKSAIVLDWRSALKAIPHFLSKTLSSIKFEVLRARIHYGFPDPADTGMVYGMAVPISMWAGDGTEREFVLQPDFSKARLDGDGDLTARFTPIMIIIPAIGLAWTVFAAPRLRRVFS